MATKESPSEKNCSSFTNYQGCVIAAPMVRVSSLAFRLFTAAHGSDIVYTEELVAAKVAKCVREEVEYPVGMEPLATTTKPMSELSAELQSYFSKNHGSGSTSAEESERKTKTVVEFVQYEAYKNEKRRVVVAQTLKKESQDHLAEGAPAIFQMGVSDPKISEAVAALVSEDFDGLDVNMGCPKKFSVDQGMGAALMAVPQKAADIMSGIEKGANSVEKVAARGGKRIPISFKTRLFDNVEDSVNQLTIILRQNPFIHSVTLHCRTRPQRSETVPNPDRGLEVVQAMKKEFPHVCFLFNGSMRSRQEAEAFLMKWGGPNSLKLSSAATVNVGGSNGDGAQAVGFDGVMVARGVMWDPTCLARRAARPDSGETAAVVKKHDAPTNLHKNPVLEMEVGVAVDVTKPAPLSIDAPLPAVCDRFLPLLRLQRQYDTNYAFVKYHLTRSFPEYPSCKKMQPQLQNSKTLAECEETLLRNCSLESGAISFPSTENQNGGGEGTEDATGDSSSINVHGPQKRNRD